jgi:hypothetical protein
MGRLEARHLREDIADEVAERARSLPRSKRHDQPGLALVYFPQSA